MLFMISINYEVTTTSLAIWLVDAVRLSSDSHWPASDYNISFKMAPYRVAIMNEDVGKFGYDSMQQGQQKKDKIYEKRTFLRTFN